jgi:hypothetical protein
LTEQQQERDLTLSLYLAIQKPVLEQVKTLAQKEGVDDNVKAIA